MPDEKSMIGDLRELESELREKGEYRKANIIDLFILYSTHCKINKSVIEKKITELDKEEQDLQNSISDEEREEYSDANISFELMDINIRREVLKELLEEDK